MLVSAIHQLESVTGMHMSFPSWTPFPPPTPSHPSTLSQSTGLSPCVTQNILNCYPFFHVLCAVLSRSVTSDSATPWTVAHQAPLPMRILQARILEWVAMPSSTGSLQPRDWTQVSCIAGGFFTIWATGEVHLFYIWKCIGFHATVSIHPTLSFPHCVHKSVLYVSPLLPCKKVHWRRLSRFHMQALVNEANICKNSH